MNRVGSQDWPRFLNPTTYRRLMIGIPENEPDPLIKEYEKSSHPYHRHFAQKLRQCNSERPCLHIGCDSCQQRLQLDILNEVVECVRLIASDFETTLIFFAISFQPVQVRTARCFWQQKMRVGLDEYSQYTNEHPVLGTWSAVAAHLHPKKDQVSFDVNMIIAVPASEVERLSIEFNDPSRARSVFSLDDDPQVHSKILTPTANGHCIEALVSQCLTMMEDMTAPWDLTINPSAGVVLADQVMELKRVIASGVFVSQASNCEVTRTAS